MSLFATPCDPLARWNSTSWPFDFINTENLDDSDGSCCIWDGRFPRQHQVFPTLLSCACLLYLIVKFHHFPLKKTTTSDSYSVLLAFFLASFFRIALTEITRSTLCPLDMGANIGSFVSYFVVFEIEWLTHLCIDRYVCAKYIFNGWEFNGNHCGLYFKICFLFGMLYSNLPYYKIVGNFTYDFDCVAYTMDMVLPSDKWLKLQVLGLYFLIAVKPVIFIVLMLIWAKHLENKFTKEMEVRNQRYFTKVVILIAAANIMCWSARGFIVAKVLLDQLIFGQIQVPHGSMLQTADLMYSISPVFTTVIFLAANYHLRDGFISSKVFQYILKPSSTKPSNKKKDSVLDTVNVPLTDPVGKEELDEKDK